MTTGRINQVAFLGDNTTRRSPSLKIPAAGPRRARKSFLSGTSGSKWAVAGAEAPAPASHSASESTSDHTWSSSARVRSTGARARCRVRPAPPGRNEAKRDTFTFEFHRSGYATQEPRRAASLAGPWAESEGGCRTTVRCSSTEPADTDNPMTTHAPPRTRNNNPDERTTAA